MTRIQRFRKIIDQNQNFLRKPGKKHKQRKIILTVSTRRMNSSNFVLPVPKIERKD